MNQNRWLVILLLASCETPDEDKKQNESDDTTNTHTVSTPSVTTSTGTPGDTGTPADTGTPMDTGTPAHTDTGPLPIFDCATIPEVPTAVTRLSAPRGYNDVVFDRDGGLIGSNGDFLFRATGPDKADVYAPLDDPVYKMGYLPDGDVVAMSDVGSIIRVTPDGVTTVVASGVYGYGMAIGSDGMIYVASNYTAGGDQIARVHPDTGEITILIDASLYPPRALEFSRDFSVLYFGTLDGGHVLKVPLDEDLNPTGDPELLITLPSGWHDTLEVDACGNLYVGSFYGWNIYRIHADLSVTELLSWDFSQYGHGFEWGSAAGGWNEQAIYVTHPYIGSLVDEVVIGVPGRQWEGEVLGGVTL